MRLHADVALLPEGWARDVAIEVDGEGRIASVAPGAAPGGAERLAGFVLPGLPNVHSHAFQRAMAGFAERRTREDDTFWTWRELMYRFAGRATPGEMEDVAAWTFAEMLAAGYTAVAEFHYVHHDPAGRPYADPAEMSRRIVAAAERAGIALTLIPVLYAHGGFGGASATPGQARFLHDTPGFLRLVETMGVALQRSPHARAGAAFHSLRAVDPAMMREALQALARIDPGMPLHIHAAEQVKEVEDCVRWSGERPVQWLLGHAPIDARWCLVHSTHLDAREVAGLAGSGAVAGLCPTTESNLGDGIFPAAGYLAAGGRFGIGTDSHVTLDAAAELRTLEYSQRLATGHRSVLAHAQAPSPGERLYRAAAAGGAQALALEAGRIAPGSRADLLVLDPGHRALWNHDERTVLDAWIFAGDRTCIRDVMVGGQWRIRDGRHPDAERLAGRFRAAQARWLA